MRQRGGQPLAIRQIGSLFFRHLSRMNPPARTERHDYPIGRRGRRERKGREQRECEQHRYEPHGLPCSEKPARWLACARYCGGENGAAHRLLRSIADAPDQTDTQGRNARLQPSKDTQATSRVGNASGPAGWPKLGRTDGVADLAEVGAT